jgi:1,4-alpha-glucan branching enzyme
MQQPELGAHVGKDGVTFTVWAPRHRSLVLRLEDRDLSMEPGEMATSR